MKQINDYWLPDDETRIEEILKESIELGRPAYQHKKLETALALCPRRRTAVDVGSHIGMWTMQFLQAGFEQVHAFDPDPSKMVCFERNILRHTPPSRHFPTAIRHHSVGLGEVETTVSLVVKKGTTLKTHVRPDPQGVLKIKPLDSFDLTEVDFLKIDVEGFELFVVKGAEATIKRERPVIVVEQKKTVAAKRYGISDVAAVQLLSNWGYQVQAEMNGDYVMTSLS